jgi:hypothetical protein
MIYSPEFPAIVSATAPPFIQAMAYARCWLLVGGTKTPCAISSFHVENSTFQLRSHSGTQSPDCGPVIQPEFR